ncbi:MAG: hypothetical protein ABIK52_06200 [Bacteroidota bacterium]
MKTIKKLSVLFALLLLGSGAFAQDCYLTIYDKSNTNGAYYDLTIELWNYTSPFNPVLLNTEYQSCYIISSGGSASVQLDYQVEPDIAKLKFHIYAENQSTSQGAWGWSQQTFDSYDYYYNHPPVTVTIP